MRTLSHRLCLSVLVLLASFPLPSQILSKELVAQQQYGPNLAREIAIMHALAHENINRLVGLCENATNTYLVLEYAHKGDLHTTITSLGSLDTNSARFVAAEILRGLEEVHRNVRGTHNRQQHSGHGGEGSAALQLLADQMGEYGCGCLFFPCACACACACSKSCTWI